MTALAPSPLMQTAAAALRLLNRPKPTAAALAALAFMPLHASARSFDYLVPKPAIEGRAVVIDGDTIGIEGEETRIRLHGIDAPESGQTCDDKAGQRYLCGSQSADFLAKLIGRNGRVTCEERDRDRYSRIVADCRTMGGADINAAMVQAGWAVAYRQYGGDAFNAEEEAAREAGRALWQGAFAMPWEWRRGERIASERKADGQPKGCPIKGNISSGGRIYHMPGQFAYGRTTIDTKAGERWFCSEGEALAAGWRAARQ